MENYVQESTPLLEIFTPAPFNPEIFQILPFLKFWLESQPPTPPPLSPYRKGGTMCPLCNSDACILVKGKITITGAGADAAARQADERDKGVAFKNCAPFTNCISEINNTQVDNAKDLDIVMPMYNLIQYSDNYAKASESLWQYYRDEPNDNLANSESFKSKIKITGKTPAAGNEKDVEIMVPLKYLRNFWRTLEIPLINCEVILILTWVSTCVITNSTDAGTFEITDRKLYVPVVTLSTQDNSKLLQQ